MKNVLLIFGFANIFSLLGEAQAPNIQWEKCIGGTDAEILWHVLPLNMNEYLIVGNSGSNDGNVSGNHGGSTDYWIVKIDSMGNILWQKCYGGSNTETNGEIISTIDGHFIFVGGTMSNDGDVVGNHSSSYFDGWVVKIDSVGNILDRKCYGGSLHDGFNDIISTSDGYILVGNTQSNDGDVSGNHHSGLGFSDVWVAKIDTTGTIQWQKCYGGFLSESAIKIFKTSDGGFVLGCQSTSSDGDVTLHYGMYDYWVLKIDSIGNLVWEKSYGGSNDDILYSMCESGDGGYILVGYTESNDGLVVGNHSTNYSDSWIIKIDSIGNLKWQKCFGGTGLDVASGIYKTFNSSFIINGATFSNDGDVNGLHNPNTNNLDMWMIQIDSMGTILWQKCLGGSAADYGTGCLQTMDSGFIALGYSNSNDGDVSSFNHGNSDAWVVRLTNVGLMVYDKHIIKDFTAFINSANNSIIISLYSKNNCSVTLQLMDITGRVLLEKHYSLFEGSNKLEVYIDDLNSGIYLLRLANSETSLTNKIVKE